MNLAIAIGGLAFLILIHEMGHFFTAIAVNMRPRKFYLFFPPALAKWKRNGIEYGLGSIPLGGYVKIPGMHQPTASDVDVHFHRALEESPWLRPAVNGVRHPLERGDLAAARSGVVELESELARADLSEPARKSAEKGVVDIGDALSDDAYWKAPVWKRVTVIFAGPATNLVFCILALAVVFMLGVPAGVTREVNTVSADTPASVAGLQQGDVITAVGRRPTLTFDAVSQAIQGSKGNPITITVRRGGEQTVLGPLQAELIDGKYRVGFIPEPFLKSYAPLPAVGKAFSQTGEVTVTIFRSLAGIVTGKTRDQVSSAVGIVQQTSQIVNEGFRYYLGVLALISLSLALLNLLPLLPLDGGHIAFAVAEKISGRAIPRQAYERASMIGIALVLILFFIGLSNDIGRIRGG